MRWPWQHEPERDQAYEAAKARAVAEARLRAAKRKTEQIERVAGDVASVEDFAERVAHAFRRRPA